MRKKTPKLHNRRTKSTVFLSPRHRELIQSSGKTVQRFFEDLVDSHSRYDMFSWREGQFFYRHVRVALIRSDFLNDLCNALPNPYETGKKLGEKARRTYKAVWNLDPTGANHRKDYYNSIAKAFGWGVLHEEPPNRLFVDSPCINNESFLRGQLEGILSVKLHLIHQASDQFVFEIES